MFIHSQVLLPVGIQHARPLGIRRLAQATKGEVIQKLASGNGYSRGTCATIPGQMTRYTETMRPGRRLHLRLRADSLAVSSKFNPLRLHVCSFVEVKMKMSTQ